MQISVGYMPRRGFLGCYRMARGNKMSLGGEDGCVGLRATWVPQAYDKT